MPAEWFYRDGTHQVGPLSGKQIRSLATAGTINPETLIRKDDETNWIKASRIKGLFHRNETSARAAGVEHEGEKDVETDPLITLTSQAASSVISAAESAASAIGGVVSGWFGRRDEQLGDVAAHADSPPTGSESRATWLDVLTRDHQSAEIVEDVAEKVRSILMEDEELIYVAVQNRPLVNWKPDCIALTNRRFIFYRPKLLGRVEFEDHVWLALVDSQLTEDMIGATFKSKITGGRWLSMDYLPKSQARAVYRIAQAMEERCFAERRHRSLEETRASAGGVMVQSNLAVPVANTQPAAIEHDDAVHKLKQLKSMADANLITAAEYEAKKAEILSRM